MMTMHPHPRLHRSALPRAAPLLALCALSLSLWSSTSLAHAQYTSRTSPNPAKDEGFDRAVEQVMEGEFEAALPALEKSAANGNAMAQYLYAALLRRGLGGPADPQRAIELLRRACQSGPIFPDAMLELAQVLEDRGGEASEWLDLLQRASTCGNNAAALELGNVHFLGKGVPVNREEAYAWYSLAANNKNEFAANNLRACEQGMDEAAIARGKQRLQEIYKLPAPTGSTLQFQINMRSAMDAAFDKGRKAYEGRQIEEARRRLEPLARNYNPGALFYVARMHETGRGYEQDYLEAARLYAAAIQQNEGTSLGNLARLFKQGLGVAKNAQAAATLYHLAAWRGDPDAQNEYALASIQGEGTERDPVAAFVWWSLAAEAGNEHAPNNLRILQEQDLPRDRVDEAKKKLEEVRAQKKQGASPPMAKLDLGTPKLFEVSTQAVAKRGYSSSVEEPKKVQSNEVVIEDSEDINNDPNKGREVPKGPGLQRWTSPDGKLALQKPMTWKVQHGDIFGGGTYGCTVQNADESAGVLFVVAPGAGQRFQNASDFAQATLEAIGEDMQNFRVTNRIQAPDGSKVRIDATFVEDGKPTVGTFQFTIDGQEGRVMALGAEQRIWKETETLLQDIALSIRYPAPKGEEQPNGRGGRRF